MIDLKEHPQGLLLPVRAQPRARKVGVTGEQAGALKVSVSAPPEDGRANKALVEVLAEALGVKKAQLELLSGATARDKQFLVRGVDRATLTARIASLLSAG